MTDFVPIDQTPTNHLDLGIYRPKRTVAFCVTGSFEITRDDGVWATADDVRDRLFVDASQVGGVIDGTVDFEVRAIVAPSVQETP